MAKTAPAKRAKERNVLNRFSANLQAKFSIKATGIKWSYGFKNKTLPDPTTAPPPYLQSVIASFLELTEIPTRFRVCIQYLVVPDKNFLISYDVIHAGQKPLSSATFDREKWMGVDLKKQEIFDTLYEALARELTKREKRTITKRTAIARALFWMTAGYIDHDIEIEEFETGSSGEKTLTVAMNTRYRRHPYGEYAAVFDLPCFSTLDKYPDKSIIMAGIDDKGDVETISNVALENMTNLELAMVLPNPKVVFIQGEPGSGKESFANAIHFGSRRGRPVPSREDAVSDRKDVEVRSVAGMKLEQFKRELYGEDVAGGFHHDGLIEKAAGRTLFLDEFDKFDIEKNDETAAKAPYSELLRVWEAKEFVPINGRSTRKVDDVNWVVAGAFTSVRRVSDLPEDIWGRFNAQLSIKSPVSAARQDEERTQYVRALILNFMLTNALKEVDREHMCNALHQVKDAKSRKAHVVRSLLFGDDTYALSGKKLKPSNIMLEITNALARYIGMYSRCAFTHGDKTVKIFLPPKLAERANYCFEQKKLSFDGGHILTEPEYDSIRAIRQACTVVFLRLYEFMIQGRGIRSNNNETTKEWVRKILFDAFCVVDIARKDTNPDQFISRDDLRNQIFAENGVVNQKSIDAIANALTAPAAGK